MYKYTKTWWVKCARAYHYDMVLAFRKDIQQLHNVVMHDSSCIVNLNGQDSNQTGFKTMCCT